MSKHTERVVVLVDMDCFYCQVEEKFNPNLKGKPIAVVQYNPWRGGGILAVNYIAREMGVTRHMRGDDAKEKCPDIIICRVPEIRGKADLTKYREAGKRVAEVLQTFTALLERASVDEAYLDITNAVNERIEKYCSVEAKYMQNTHVVGYPTVQSFLDASNSNRDFIDSDYKLAVGGLIAEEIRAKVYEITGYRCSAGIAHNKILAKLVCGLHKPNQQTVLPHSSVPELYKTLPVKKIKSLGGKFGVTLTEELKINYMAELVNFSEKELCKRFDEKTASWLFNIARGIDLEPVTVRLISKSIGCCKRFPGKTALKSKEDVAHWVNQLADEMSERLETDFEENNRKAKQIVVCFAQDGVSSSRTQHLPSYEKAKIFQIGLNVINKHCLRPDNSYCITFLGFNAANFETCKGVREITSFFKNSVNTTTDRTITDNTEQKSNKIKSFFELSLPHTSIKNNNVHEKNKKTLQKENGREEENKICPSNSTESDDEVSSSSSIYSRSTDLDENDTKDLVYYHEVFPSSINLTANEDNVVNISNNSNDSLSQELADDCNSIENAVTHSKTPECSSFFAKYFGIQCETPRNFNTSKNLENADIDAENFIHSDSAIDESPEQSNDLGNKCLDCGKLIPLEELHSHMDYHFAIKIVKSEAHLYNQPSVIKNSESSTSKKIVKSPIKKSTKRKSSEVNSNNLLTFFAKSEDADGENYETCDECGKKIKLDDILSHMDYHAAKKLHMEINSAQSSFKSNLANKNNSPSSKKCDKIRSISSYFKT